MQVARRLVTSDEKTKALAKLAQTDPHASAWLTTVGISLERLRLWAEQHARAPPKPPMRKRDEREVLLSATGTTLKVAAGGRPSQDEQTPRAPGVGGSASAGSAPPLGATSIGGGGAVGGAAHGGSRVGLPVDWATLTSLVEKAVKAPNAAAAETQPAIAGSVEKERSMAVRPAPPRPAPPRPAPP